MSQEVGQLVDGIAASEEARGRLAQLLAKELGVGAPQSRWKRLQPFLAGLSSGAVVVLAFLLPSIQEQWERHETQSAIERYADVAGDLMKAEHYAAAEQSFARALELAGNNRLDLLEGQLKARVMRIYDSAEWRADADESITEPDFLYLLEIEPAASRPLERGSTLSAYGAFLAGLRRWTDAESALREAIALQPNSAAPHIHLGNLFGDLGRPVDAENEYRRAIELDPKEPNARYNLGLLLAETSRPALAEIELRNSAELAPDDMAARLALIDVLIGLGKSDEARQQIEAAKHIDSDNAELTKLMARLERQPVTASRAAPAH